MRLIVAILVLLALLGGGWFVLREPDSTYEVELGSGDRVLDLVFQDYSGSELRLNDFIGTPMIVNSWATWCLFCIKELPDLDTVAEELGSRVNIIAVNRAESLEIAKDYTDDLGVAANLHLFLDPTDSFYRDIGGFAMPETLFVNADGTIHFHKRGVMTLEEIRQRTQELL